MKWPMGETPGRPPSRELLKFCMLENVKTLGLPMYHPRATETQLVALSATIENAITTSQGRKFFIPLAPSSAFWNPSRKSALVSLSGGFDMTGQVYKPVNGKDVSPLRGEDGFLGPCGHQSPQRPPARAFEDGKSGRQQSPVRRERLLSHVGWPSVGGHQGCGEQ
ncbi:hypothetical protein FOQG_12685 [Fusarium oxysporum f. sp. raphani 54005]|uniref:Uncharacterized protein n=1 Tax=Fusarium oxysporum f. sp. raphani 54005 TaxID=1089458 RepID=X0BMC9_FUSOX|nr:hypothetical protein FOQG_12685 [Fusarium oxysporum f. sp. raphani 54005]KAJ4085765.1 hypothetical protein NW761_008880 [Fusarium oxysporum]KAJ4110823.1 hypothetical protein NW769_006993 [Fusarium oxysporum]KAJ4231640.1 hypothetical protein NW760_006445 [Fusarium oxysporum]